MIFLKAQNMENIHVTATRQQICVMCTAFITNALLPIAGCDFLTDNRVHDEVHRISLLCFIRQLMHLVNNFHIF